MKFKLVNSFIIILFSSMLYSADEVVINSFFFRKFYGVHHIHKDEYLESFQNRIIIGKGYIKSVKEKHYFKRKYEICIEQKGTDKIRFIYHIYLNNKNTIDLLNQNSFFEFKGQLVGITPVDTRRTIYILDVIFMDGSTIIN